MHVLNRSNDQSISSSLTDINYGSNTQPFRGLRTDVMTERVLEYYSGIGAFILKSRQLFTDPESCFT